MNVFISLQRLLVCRTELLGTVSNTSLEVIQPVPVLNPTQLLSLNCFVLDDNVENVFTVKVEKTENVSILKKLIKEEKAPHFDHVAASDLDLWIVDLRLDDLGAKPVHVNDLGTSSKLSARRKLSTFFSGIVDDECLHIIAKAPGMSH